MSCRIGTNDSIEFDFFNCYREIQKDGKVAIITILALLVILGGCESTPKALIGDTATIDDSFQKISKRKANLFFISTINGKNVDNGFKATHKATYGNYGVVINPRGTSRVVYALPLTLVLDGQVNHSAPIGFLFNAGSNHRVWGEIKFTPEVDGHYLVNGSLSESYSAVWIEDINGNIVSNVVEKKGADDITIKAADMKSVKQVRSREDQFLELSAGESARLVTRKLGSPDRTSKYKGKITVRRLPYVNYHYSDLGVVRFSTGIDGAAQYVEKAISILHDVDTISSMQAALGTEGITLRNFARTYYKQDLINTKILDLIAERIWVGRNAEESYTVDGLSWLCRILGSSGNARYITILEKISNEASSKKLRKFAGKSLKLLPADGVEQFVANE